MTARSLIHAVEGVASRIFLRSAPEFSLLINAQPNDRHGMHLKSPSADPWVCIDAASFPVYPGFGDTVVIDWYDKFFQLAAHFHPSRDGFLQLPRPATLFLPCFLVYGLQVLFVATVFYAVYRIPS